MVQNKTIHRTLTFNIFPHLTALKIKTENRKSQHATLSITTKLPSIILLMYVVYPELRKKVNSEFYVKVLLIKKAISNNKNRIYNTSLQKYKTMKFSPTI